MCPICPFEHVYEDTASCLLCSPATAAYSAAENTNVQSGILDTGASAHIVKHAAQMANSRASSRVFAGFNGSTAECIPLQGVKHIDGGNRR